jgi:hypothetical protein
MLRTFRDEIFGMTGRLGSQLTKLAEIRSRQRITRQVQHGVLQGTGVSIAKHETIAVDPGRILSAVEHGFRPKEVGHRSAAHGRTGVSRVGCLGLIGRDGTDRVDALGFQVGDTHTEACG